MFAGFSLGVRLVFAGCSLGVRRVFVGCSLGVRCVRCVRWVFAVFAGCSLHAQIYTTQSAVPVRPARHRAATLPGAWTCGLGLPPPSLSRRRAVRVEHPSHVRSTTLLLLPAAERHLPVAHRYYPCTTPCAHERLGLQWAARRRPCPPACALVLPCRLGWLLASRLLLPRMVEWRCG